MFKNKKGVNWSEKHFLFLDIYKKIDSLGEIQNVLFPALPAQARTSYWPGALADIEGSAGGGSSAGERN